MGKLARRTRKPPVQFESTVIEVERQELSYALWQREERSPVGLINRVLTLYGRVLIGEPKLQQLPAVVVSFGRENDRVTIENARGVAVLHKTKDRADVTASVPIDFMATLSHAFHDGRISIVQDGGRERCATLLSGHRSHSGAGLSSKRKCRQRLFRRFTADPLL